MKYDWDKVWLCEVLLDRELVVCIMNAINGAGKGGCRPVYYNITRLYW